MNNSPNLVIQLQRLGDLILSFPMLVWLQASEPDHPVWVVAEEGFFKGLIDIAPKTVFFPPTALPDLEKIAYRRIINLSHRATASQLAGSLRTKNYLGQVDFESEQKLFGKWRQYRSSIIHNNRHNLFHWTDLNALDLISLRQMRHTDWVKPQNKTNSGKVGLFVGASEEQKRPSEDFWFDLVQGLLKRGLKPVLLGGKAEASLGRAIATRLKMPRINFCGAFSILELVQIVQGLDLLVTPDTGPMHLAAWAGTLTLDLSMANVNPFETAPAMPGHYVLRPKISCNSCWQCSRLPDSNSLPVCREYFSADYVAALVRRILRKESDKLIKVPNLELLQTARNKYGLFELVNSDLSNLDSARYILANFWRFFFLEAFIPHFTYLGEDAKAVHVLAQTNARIYSLMLKQSHKVELELKDHLVQGKILADDYWQSAPPYFRPLQSYLQIILENESYSKEAWDKALTLLEKFILYLNS